MIDIKTLNDYTKYINLKQVCALADVNYNTVSDKVRKYRYKNRDYFTKEELSKLTKGLKKIGIKEPKLNIKN